METSKGLKKYFTARLLNWHANENSRSLPWKNEHEPYKIWLSEVILQQTRALQGLPYYNNFTTTYPTIIDLAQAADEDVFRIWQGLGYYNRCKNMLATARLVAREFGGKFPDTYEGIIALKGIGPYTASAIASFAFGLPHAVVDGNVYRVLSRYFGIEVPIDGTEGKRIFSELAQELLDPKQSEHYNQAIMDLGATVCTPRNTQCELCPLQKNCMAYNQELVSVLPVKSKKITVSTRYFNYLLLKWKNNIWIHKRGPKDIWENLHEPYLVETEKAMEIKELIALESIKNLNLPYDDVVYSGNSTQRLTHRIIDARFYTIELTKRPVKLPAEGAWMPAEELKKIAFPKTVLTFLKNNYYF